MFDYVPFHGRNIGLYSCSELTVCLHDEVTMFQDRNLDRFIRKPRGRLLPFWGSGFITHTIREWQKGLLGHQVCLASGSLSGWGEQSTEPPLRWPYRVQKWNFPIILLDPFGGLGRSAMCCVHWVLILWFPNHTTEIFT